MLALLSLILTDDADAILWIAACVLAMPTAWCCFKLTAIGVKWLIAQFRKPPPPICACPVCGYDLRETPHRCPECGTAMMWGIPAVSKKDQRRRGRYLARRAGEAAR